MKNHFLNFLILAIAVFWGTAMLAVAHDNHGGLYRLRVGKNYLFTISVDGNATRELRNEHLLHLSPGVHRIKVRIPPPASAPWMPYQTVYKGKIIVKPHTETIAFVDMNNNLRIFQEKSLVPPPANQPNQHNGHHGHGEGHHGHGNHDSHHNEHATNQPNSSANYNPYNSPNGGYGNDNDEVYSMPNNQASPNVTPATPAPPASVAAMPSANFQALKDLLRSKSFDDERIAIAQQAIGQTPITCAQLRELITTLSFEQSRLDLAKYAHKHLVDVQNFQVIYSEFRFNSSIQELTKL